MEETERRSILTACTAAKIRRLQAEAGTRAKPTEEQRTRDADHEAKAAALTQRIRRA